ncbi:hypothetical protein THTE_1794 [Thermogutta terrifontis]|uniref:Uncharacterized protein n=1 Tax=Thermogutta terrifontis TaxID=1331910 RepID=A0A286REK9_9BACT|nr:hypothetical protein THTE_1794 [Thermogutta terrifontis]
MARLLWLRLLPADVCFPPTGWGDATKLIDPGEAAAFWMNWNWIGWVGSGYVSDLFKLRKN